MSTEVAVVEPAKEGLMLSVTSEMIERFKGYVADLTVKDIHDNKALKIVHDRRMELVKARTSLDKYRKAMNEEAKRQIENNNQICKNLLDQMAPIEQALTAEENRIEMAREAERVEAANRIFNDRVAKLKEVGAEVPEAVLRKMSEEMFEHTMVISRAQAAERDRLEKIRLEQEAERQRIEAEQSAERERLEAEQRRQQEAEAERLRQESERLAAERAEMERKAQEQREEEDRRRREEAAEMDRQRAELEEQRKKQEEAAAAAQAELDRQMAEIAEQRRQTEEASRRVEEERLQAIERERLAKEAEEKRLADEAAERERRAEEDRQRAIEQARLAKEADERRIAEERRVADEKSEQERLAREAEERRVAEEQQAAAQAEAERKMREELQPDLDKLAAYIIKVAGVKFPEVGENCQAIANDVSVIIETAIREMRDRIAI